ncbi:uncharacterized protein LOC132715785 [Ruditapes philippinarum]|uniref:uncharacterized protein LOC132715785 n=1 Tax=Ruditapes philippinarum TaxID=129788 RepID=UPI00295B94E2|nr:uncharacterized protein LOC132715785 [Ruditapes philippinarum]
MAEFDSLSFALLIPFAICFALVFIVCCFADEIKDICRMPSPLPNSYLGVDRSRTNRRVSRNQRRVSRPQNEEVRNLILSEEGRSRNVSESSTEHNQVNTLLANSNINIVRQPGPGIPQGAIVSPQSLLPSGSESQTVPRTSGQIFRIPSTNCIVSRPSVHSSVPAQGSQRIIIQPLGHFAARNGNKGSNNLNRNLAIHVSATSKDVGACIKQHELSNECVSRTNNKQMADTRETAPQLLDNYLTTGSSLTKQSLKSTNQEPVDGQNSALR